MAIEEHGHCEICGRVVKLGTRVCSPECQEKLDEQTKEKKRAAMKFVLLIAALVVLSVLLRNY